MKKLTVVVLAVTLLISYSINLVSASTVYVSHQTVGEAVESYQTLFKLISPLHNNR